MADIQEPTSFGEERRRAEKAGTRIVWPLTLSAYDSGTGEVRFAKGESLEADLVVQAIGEIPDYGEFLPDTVLLNLEGRVSIPKDSFRSTDPKIYVIGDAVTPGLITHSIGMGRLAALEIHAHFRGEDFVFPTKEPVPKNRIRLLYFEEGEEESEADRCLSCGTCIQCDICVEACPKQAISRDGEVFTVAESCTGCKTCEAVCPRGAVTVE